MVIYIEIQSKNRRLEGNRFLVLLHILSFDFLLSYGYMEIQYKNYFPDGHMAL